MINLIRFNTLLVEIVALLFVVLLPIHLKAESLPVVDSDSLKRDLERVRTSFKVPGMAVVAIQDGKIVFQGGFGLRNVEKNEPFTPDTLSLVASTTKSITAGLVGTLVDDGTLDWTRPVREYWTEFKMFDDFATREMTLEDMMSHRSGLPSHENLLAHGVNRELPDREKARQYRRDLLKRLAYFEPSHSFRSYWEYQDVIYTSAGAIIEQVTGQHYESLVKKRILEPIGMNESTFSRREARETGRLAQGYGIVDGKVKAIPFCDTRYFAPTAGLYSTANEMAKWIQLQINKGKVYDRQVISEDSMAWIHGAHSIVTNDGIQLDGGLVTYGQGWMKHSFQGHETVGHGGSFNGYRTHIIFIPEKRIGVVVLTNLNLSHAMTAASFVTMARLMGNDQTDHWIDHFSNFEAFSAKAEEDAKREFESGRDLTKKHRHSLKDYTGSFHHPGYGTFIVSLRDNTLQQTYDGRTYKVSPYAGETFETHYQSTENHLHHMTMTFESDDSGKAIAVHIPIVPGIKPPRFVRM